MTKSFNRKKIIFGVCGIGLGHAVRQINLIRYYAKSGAEILVFSEKSVIKFLKLNLKDFDQKINFIEVFSAKFLDQKQNFSFEFAAQKQVNNANLIAKNLRALAQAEKILGIADVVISDGESVCASYAYAYKIPLITIHDQNKYFLLKDQKYEQNRRLMRFLFPVADKKLICSFYNFSEVKDDQKIQVIPPIIRSEIIAIKDVKANENNILVYINDFDHMTSKLANLVDLFANYQHKTFYFIVPKRFLKTSGHKNIHFLPYGHKNYYHILSKCAAIISAPGHSLASEAMFLSKPIFCIPFSHHSLVAKIIADNKFGMSGDLNAGSLTTFLDNIAQFTQFIKDDKNILLRQEGSKILIKIINRFL